MLQNPFKAVGLCLHPSCPQSSRYVNDLSLRHNPICSKHIFSLNQLLSELTSPFSSSSLPSYPPTPLGLTVKSKLLQTKNNNKTSYLDVIMDDFNKTVMKITEGIREDLREMGLGSTLEAAYNAVYSLAPILKLVQNKSASSLITQQLKYQSSPQKLHKLSQSNTILDTITTSLSSISLQLSSLLTTFKSSTLTLLTSPVHTPPRPDFFSHFTSDQLIYQLIPSKSPESSKITFQSGWIVFPESEENVFKPWVLSEKGWSTGVHRIKFVAEYPKGKGKNCGVCVVKEGDKDVYPYGVYKSLYDRIAREFQLTKGEEVYKVEKEEMLEVLVVMDLNQKRVVMTEGKGRWEYECKLKEATVYYFGIAGADWRVKVMHIS